MSVAFKPDVNTSQIFQDDGSVPQEPHPEVAKLLKVHRATLYRAVRT
jgi:hypothetical protein